MKIFLPTCTHSSSNNRLSLGRDQTVDWVTCSQTLRQDNTGETVHLLTHETPDYITPALWPASPNLNPVDYQIWWKLQERVYRSQIRDVDQLSRA